MADQSDEQTPRLDPMASPEARAAFVRELKALVGTNEYIVPTADIARAVLANLATFRHSG